VSGLVVDLFAGGGGASVGIEAALGRSVDIAINHDPIALAVHRANHPATRHLEADIWEVQPLEATEGAPVDLLWASPACTHFSVAKGAANPLCEKIRSLAWVVVDWARDVRPRVIALENVREFLGWGPLNDNGRPDRARLGETFDVWRRQLEHLGYVVDYRVLDASLYGAPTRRRRLFFLARCDGQAIRWPEPTHGPGRLPLRTAAECVDWSIPCPSIFDRRRPLAEKTLRRIGQGIRRFVLETKRPYIVPFEAALVAPSLVQTGYGERPGQRPRFLNIHEPLGTLVNGQKHALVAAFLARHFGGVVGQDLQLPLPTVTARDHHSVVEASLSADHGDARVDRVRAFLTVYYGQDETGGQSLLDPLRTVTAKHRLGLVTVAGADYQIVDIGLRMLEPHELLAAQFGRFADNYDLDAARTKSAKIRLIGNSVAPEVAEAIITANCQELAEVAA
jgi:DNA (cytosine-5)-methyltransferase 1